MRLGRNPTDDVGRTAGYGWTSVMPACGKIASLLNCDPESASSRDTSQPAVTGGAYDKASGRHLAEQIKTRGRAVRAKRS